MNILAGAFIQAVTYLSLRDDSDPARLDQDVEALEAIAATLENATRAEFLALLDAATRAKESELRAEQPHPGRLETYEHWIELFREEAERLS